MVYKLYKLSFSTVHFGEGHLDNSAMTFSANRLFSALVLEAIKQGMLDAFMDLANSENFVLTDAFPYKVIPYLPKPIGYPNLDRGDNYDAIIQQRQKVKKAKKLSFLPYDHLDAFLEGKDFDDVLYAKRYDMTKNQIDEVSGLYQVGAMRFEEDVSLYIIASESKLFNHLMMGLQHSGLGGKRTSGYGLFDLDIEALPKELDNRLTLDSRQVMLLTTALPKDEEVRDTLVTGKYLLKKSSGFAFSRSVQENYRKQDLYKLASGSTFCQTFEGLIVDVRPDGFPHPVWNYAKPLFYKLGV